MKLICIACVLVALALPSLAMATPGIYVWPESVRPGEPVFVTVESYPGVETGSCTWMKKTYALSPLEDGLYAVLPVPASAKPGAYQLPVTYRGQRGEEEMGETRAFTVTVRPRTFTVQRLKLSAKQEAKYEDPGVKREYRLIGAALDRVTPKELWRGNFLMPVNGRVSTAYGLQRYVNGHFEYRHRGLDIAAALGTPVKAAADGVVSLADSSFHLHGKTIIIDHGLGVSTVYLHLSRIEVSVGAKVKQGQIIGRVGRTGVATGPHLHYGLYVHHEAMDPVYWTHLPFGIAESR